MENMEKSEIDLIINNALTNAPGEPTLKERLSPFMATATAWFEKWFCPLSLISPRDTDAEGKETGYSLFEKDSVLKLADRIIVTEAYRLAVPQWDLVLTANGFATVDSKNVVPASKARTERLLEGLVEKRDADIKILLHRLPFFEGWLQSEQALFFRQTLFQNPEELVCLPRSEHEPISVWERYISMIPKIKDLEDSLADDWFSPELMEELRKEKQDGKITGLRRSVAGRIMNQIAANFSEGDFKCRVLQDILNIVRKNPFDFPEWVHSETAELFFPPVFKNKKDSPGYFF